MTVRERIRRGHMCGVKLAHDNYWQALQHAASLGKANDGFMTTYICDFCGNFHVGHAHWLHKALRHMRRMIKTISHPNFQAKARPEVIQRMNATLELLKEQHPQLEEYLR